MILACLQSGERICLLNLFLLRNSNGTFLWNAFYKKAYCLSSFQNYRLKMSNLCQLTSSSLRLWSYLLNFHLTPTLGVKILFWIRPLTFINNPICEKWKKLPRWEFWDSGRVCKSLHHALPGCECPRIWGWFHLGRKIHIPVPEKWVIRSHGF